MYETSVAVIGVGVLFFLGIIATHIDKEHALLKMFFLIMGLWFGVGLLNLGMHIITDNAGATEAFDTIRTLYWALVVMSMFTTFYFVLYYIKLFLEDIKQSKKKVRLGNA